MSSAFASSTAAADAAASPSLSLGETVPPIFPVGGELPDRSGTSTKSFAPAVSVVVGCHNYEEFLPRAIESVLGQTYRDFEILIVDDGSTDRSYAVAQRLSAENKTEIPIRVLRLDDVGPTAARRAAVEQSRGRYYLPLDADDKIAPTFLARTVPVLEADPRVGFAYVDTVYFGDTEQHHRQPEYDFARLCAGNFVSYCSLLRRSAFDAVDGYDRANWGYYEDWDLWIRLGQAGWRGRHVAEPLFFYHHHFSSSLSFYAQRLDPVYRAYIVSQHPQLYAAATVGEAQAVLAEMPAGWHARPPLREIETIQKLLVQHPDNRHLPFFLALAQSRQGLSPAAVATLEGLLARHPGDRQARQLLQQFQAPAMPEASRPPASAASAPRAGASCSPLVSVVVPCYQQAEYLPDAVGSVLAQTFGDWELIIVNDGSPDDTSRVAREIIGRNPGRRIRLIEKKNGGLADARNAGVRVAKGQYILPLDADDKIHPQMLAKTMALLEQHPEVAIAYTDWQYFGAQQHTRAALDYDFTRLCTKENLFTCTSLYRKEAWAAVGGYNPNMTHGVEDWDFWIGCGEQGFFGRRIPEALFYYRAKPGSMIQTLQPHLPAMFARIILNHPRLYNHEIVEKARQLFEAAKLPAPRATDPGVEWVPPIRGEADVDQAMREAESCIQRGQFKEAIEHLTLVLQLSPTAERVSRAQALMEQIPRPAPAAGPQPTVPAANTGNDFFGPDEVKTIEQLLASYANNPADPAVLGQVRALQQGLADFLLGAELERLESFFAGDFGKVYRGVRQSSLPSEPPSAEQQARASSLAAGLASVSGEPADFDLRQLLAHMLYTPAHWAPVPLAWDRIPAWFFGDYLGYILHAPQVYVRAGEAESYTAHLLSCMREMQRCIRTAPAEPRTREAAAYFTTHANFIPCYATQSNTKELMERRAAILEFFLKQRGAVLNATLPKRPKHRQKIRVGYLNAHFTWQTETHVALPSLQLDRSKFEICLFPLKTTGGALEDYCRSLADEFTPLPAELHAQVEAIRHAALDVIIIGTNITAVTNQIALLASHRLAPLQLVSYCSPMSTGMRQIDGYLSGTSIGGEGLGAHFTEKLFRSEGPPGCLDYTVENRAPSARFDRASLGLADGDVVFVNAASCFKIPLELQETWAKILAAVKSSRLLLLPFNPNWASTFPVRQFERTLGDAFRRHGLGEDRFVLVQSLPSRADVKELEKIADIYLDTFPFSGSLSTIDPLELGLPVVVWEGRTHRSRAAAALLRELEMPELIAPDEPSYVRISVQLATDPAFRRQIGARILERMARRPRFVDPSAYGKQLGDLIERLCSGGKMKRAVVPQVAHR